MLRFSRIQIRLSWQQQEYTEVFCFKFWSQPSHPGSISLSWLLMEKVCISWKVVGHLSYDIACGVKELIPLMNGYVIDGEDLDLMMRHFVL